jgi:glycosyl transferase family 25
MLVLINLETAVERRRVMARQLADFGLAFTRVGVDMRVVRAADIDAEVERRLPGMRFDRKALSAAEIGCWVSHLSAWRLLLQSGSATCTVVEDDLVLLPGFDEAIAAIAARPSIDIVYLGTYSRNVSQRRRIDIGGQAVHEPVGVILNTWGYNVTREFAARFLAADHRTIALPIDHYLGGRGRRARPRIGVLQPTVVREDPVLGTASQIGPYTRRFDRSPWFERARRRMMASPVSDLYYSLYRYL